MMNSVKQIATLLILSVALLSGCGGGSDPGASESQESSDAQKSNGLTAFEQEHGIGPVTEEVTLSDIDMEKVEKGKALFKMKCSACHKIGERYVGPKLDEVLEDRTPTYVMNMILNPDGMVKKHPEAKKMLAEFLSPMPNQGLTEEEARNIVEYLASVQEEEDDHDDK